MRRLLVESLVSWDTAPMSPKDSRSTRLVSTVESRYWSKILARPATYKDDFTDQTVKFYNHVSVFGQEIKFSDHSDHLCGNKCFRDRLWHPLVCASIWVVLVSYQVLNDKSCAPFQKKQSHCRIFPWCICQWRWFYRFPKQQAKIIRWWRKQRSRWIFGWQQVLIWFQSRADYLSVKNVIVAFVSDNRIYQ